MCFRHATKTPRRAGRGVFVKEKRGRKFGVCAVYALIIHGFDEAVVNERRKDYE